jgi:hypothetical protein
LNEGDKDTNKQERRETIKESIYNRKEREERKQVLEGRRGKRERKERGEILNEDGKKIRWMKEICKRRQRIKKERGGENKC